MEYKILESNGTENENVDGAAFNNFVSGGKDCIIKGVLNSCSLLQPSSNTIGINTGELLIHGFRVKITDPFIHTFSSSPAVELTYYIIATIALASDRGVAFDLFVTTVESTVQDSLYDKESGAYSCKVAQFTHTKSGITDATLLLAESASGGLAKYLEKVETVTPYSQVYKKTASGRQLMRDSTSQVVGLAVVERDAQGQVHVPELPTDRKHAASMGYVEDRVLNLSSLWKHTLRVSESGVENTLSFVTNTNSKLGWTVEDQSISASHILNIPTDCLALTYKNCRVINFVQTYYNTYDVYYATNQGGTELAKIEFVGGNYTVTKY